MYSCVPNRRFIFFPLFIFRSTTFIRSRAPTGLAYAFLYCYIIIIITTRTTGALLHTHADGRDAFFRFQSTRRFFLRCTWFSFIRRHGEKHAYTKRSLGTRRRKIRPRRFPTRILHVNCTRTRRGGISTVA